MTQTHDSGCWNNQELEPRVEEGRQTNIEDFGVANVVGTEDLVVAGVEVEIELVESFGVVIEVPIVAGTEVLVVARVEAAIVAGVEVEVELGESFEVVIEVAIAAGVEVEVVIEVAIVAGVDDERELVESFEVVIEVEIGESFEVAIVAGVGVEVEIDESCFEAVIEVALVAGIEVEVELVESFEVAIVVVGPMEQHNYCRVPAPGFQGKFGNHRDILVHWGRQVSDACFGWKPKECEEHGGRLMP